MKAKQKDFGRLNRKEMSVWEAIELLDTIVDDSDPDNDNSQIWPALQSVEAAREAGLPRWLVLAAFIREPRQVAVLFRRTQWAVVGDTFPLGCPFSDQIVFPEFFAEIPDLKVPEYQRPYRIYEPGCGLDHAFMSWGARRIPLRGHSRSPAHQGAIHHPRPFVLSAALRAGIPLAAQPTWPDPR